MDDPFSGWAILELMGHRRLGGKVSEVERYGVKMCRIDIPDTTTEGKMYMTQLYGGGAVYCQTMCTEEMARAVAKHSQPRPVEPWELPQLVSKPIRTCECGAFLGPDDGSRCSECVRDFREDEIISSPPPEATETNLEQPCEC